MGYPGATDPRTETTMATSPQPGNTTAAQHHATHGGAEHVHGTMDVRDHERAFAGFVRISAWSAVASLAVLVFLALANA